MNARIFRIPTGRSVVSLDWDGDELVDWCGGGRRFGLDGSARESDIHFAFPFDAAAVSPSGQYIALYKKLGTKALLIDRSLRHVREINRSFYHAHVYEYPIALVRIFDGREILVHCPGSYNRLEIEEVETGRSLTETVSRRPADFFHSRLCANNEGTRLISAGWIWHPFDTVAAFDLRRAMEDPLVLDQAKPLADLSAETTSAAFQDDQTLIIWSAADAEDFSDDEDGGPLRHRPGTLATYDLNTFRFVNVTPLHVPAGLLMPLRGEHVVGFHGHPRLIHVPSGQIVQEWPDIVCGVYQGSILHHLPAPPPIALDPQRARFAVAQGGAIAVVQITGIP